MPRKILELLKQNEAASIKHGLYAAKEEEDDVWMLYAWDAFSMHWHCLGSDAKYPLEHLPFRKFIGHVDKLTGEIVQEI